MTSRVLSLPLSMLAALVLATSGPARAFDDGDGREWRQVAATAQPANLLSWAQVAAVCPQDGANLCTAKLGAFDMKDWVWATAPQVRQLFGRYAPTFLTSPTAANGSASIGGYEYFTAASNFFANFLPTASSQGCPNYQPCWNMRWVTGMSASADTSSGTPVALGGEVVLDLEWMQGYFQIQNPMTNSARGLWMWRPTGLGTGAVHANDDVGAVPNVLANDWVGGARATLANVDLAQLSSSVAGVWLDLATGAVRVEPGTAIGSYSLVYRICSKASPSTCDDATVTLSVVSYPISAVADQGAASMGAGGTAIANVLANDKLGSLGATLAGVSLSQVSSTHPGVRLDVLDGSVDVARGTPHGMHSLVYRICERANPTNCAQATATVRPFVIDALNDTARFSSKTGGVAIASVLANDFFNGARATTPTVTISLPAPLPKGISLNLSTGAVSVQPKISSGTYLFNYQICETASPANCDVASVALDLSGRSGD